MLNDIAVSLDRISPEARKTLVRMTIGTSYAKHISKTQVVSPLYQRPKTADNPYDYEIRTNPRDNHVQNHHCRRDVAALDFRMQSPSRLRM
jgi:hypothetical protein